MTAHPTASMAATLDARIYRRFRLVLLDRKRTERAIRAVVVAQHAWLAVGAVVTLVDRERRRDWARANAALAAAWTAAKLMSRTTGRPRPDFGDCPPARRKDDRESFPSTHATVSFAAAVAVPPLLPTAPLLALATATASARLLLGDHYPSDVAAGAVLGSAIGAVACRRSS